MSVLKGSGLCINALDQPEIIVKGMNGDSGNPFFFR